MTKKGLIGLAIGILVVGGVGLSTTHAETCDRYSSANCWRNLEQSRDPGYQSAVRSNGWYTPRYYSYDQYDTYYYDDYAPRSRNQDRYRNQDRSHPYRTRDCSDSGWYVDSFNQLRNGC